MPPLLLLDSACSWLSRVGLTWRDRERETERERLSSLPIAMSEYHKEIILLQVAPFTCLSKPKQKLLERRRDEI